jgi:hypothetical protein
MVYINDKYDFYFDYNEIMNTDKTFVIRRIYTTIDQPQTEKYLIDDIIKLKDGWKLFDETVDYRYIEVALTSTLEYHDSFIVKQIKDKAYDFIIYDRGYKVDL